MRTSEPYTVKLTFGPDQRLVDVGHIIDLSPEGGFRFDCGAVMDSVPIAYQTYGTLNADKSNAILLCHGLTGDQYLSGKHPVTGKDGWWAALVGPGNVFDTDKYFLISTNVIGGCLGSLGPKSINPLTGAVYGMDFPVITIADMVRAQASLVDAFGISKLFSVIGGSMGGMLALEWAARYPHRVFSCAPIATAARHSAQNIAFHEIGRQAIMADPDWAAGRYLEQKTFPAKGLAVARMTAHVTYLSEMGLQEKFGRRLQEKSLLPQGGRGLGEGASTQGTAGVTAPSPNLSPVGGEGYSGSRSLESHKSFKPAYSYGFEVDFQVESYLRHQGAAFIERFDPNSYLYITRAMDYFDLAADAGGALPTLFRDSPVRFCLVAFSSDWLFPPAESRHIVRALNAVAANVSYTEIDTDKGHDAFLLDVPAFHRTLQGFLDGAAVAGGV